MHHTVPRGTQKKIAQQQQQQQKPAVGNVSATEPSATTRNARAAPHHNHMPKAKKWAAPQITRRNAHNSARSIHHQEHLQQDYRNKIESPTPHRFFRPASCSFATPHRNRNEARHTMYQQSLAQQQRQQQHPPRIVVAVAGRIWLLLGWWCGHQCRSLILLKSIIRFLLVVV